MSYTPVIAHKSGIQVFAVFINRNIRGRAVEVHGCIGSHLILTPCDYTPSHLMDEKMLCLMDSD